MSQAAQAVAVFMGGVTLALLIGIGLVAVAPQASAHDGYHNNYDEYAKVSVAKTDQRDITRPGHTLTYTITVQNEGTVDVHDLNITDAAPAELTILSASAGSTISGNKVVWGNVTVEAGGTKEFTVTAQVKENTADGWEVCNDVMISSDDHDLYLDACDCTTVERPPIVQAAVEQPKPAPVPITAPTGMTGLAALVTSLIIGTGIALVARNRA